MTIIELRILEELTTVAMVFTGLFCVVGLLGLIGYFVSLWRRSA
jgi:hypothetical protein